MAAVVLAATRGTAQGADNSSVPQLELDHRLLFDSGKEGYPRYRIPSLVVTTKGTLLAFCEGRKDGGGLTGNIDLVFKRSTDAGKTWSGLMRVADAGGDTLGNPCVVVDRSDGALWLAFSRSDGRDTEKQIVDSTGHGPTRAFITHSVDDGLSWSPPREITTDVRHPSWTWYGMGPGVGIQTTDGRLLIPAYHAERESKVYRSHVIYSDDHGKTWQRGGTTGEHCGECQLAERKNGEIYLNARTNQGTKLRTIANSRDGGRTFLSSKFERQLYDPPCQASVLALPSRAAGKPLWLYASPRGPGRRDLAIRTSGDEGGHWQLASILRKGDSQYSCLAQLRGGHIGCLYDCWVDGNYRLFFVRFRLSSLGVDEK